MVPKHNLFFASGRVPDSHGLVFTTADQRLAVGRECQAADYRVALERGPLLAGFHVPKLDKAVFASRGDHFAVGRECDNENAVSMAAEDLLFVAQRGVP